MMPSKQDNPNDMLILDVETSKKPHFKAWDPKAFLVLVGLRDVQGNSDIWVFNHKENDYEKSFLDCCIEIQEKINEASLIAGHNLKFDLQWLQKIGINYDHCKLYCTQVGEYLIRGQSKDEGALSLDYLADHYGLEKKKDTLKNYYEDGYETDEIPLSELTSYLFTDLDLPFYIYQRQVEQINEYKLHHVIALQMETLRVLAEVEMNGMVIDEGILNEQYREYEARIGEIDKEVGRIVGRNLNFNSGTQLSCALFGGCYPVGAREWFYAEYRSGRKLRTRRTKLDKKLKGLGFKPKPEWVTKKTCGDLPIYSTDVLVLSQLRGKTREQKAFLELIQERRKIKKQQDLILSNQNSGLLQLAVNGKVHTNFNQTVTATTRLSSSSPNLQNIPRGSTSPVKRAFRSRYE